MKNKLILGFLMLFCSLFFIQGRMALAAPTPVQIYEVDYEEENIIVQNNENSRIYFATEIEASRERWEVINADPGATTEVDFSWVSNTTDNVLVFKGEENPTQVRVILPQQTRKLDISIDYSKINSLSKNDTIGSLLNIMTTAGTAKEPITFDDLEWRKGDNGKWKDASELTLAQLEKYQVKGTHLYFRIKPVNDVIRNGVYPDGSKGNRPSKEVKLRITKKSAPMVVGIDGSKFNADIKYGKEYRVTIGNQTSDWVQVYNRSIRQVALKDIVKNIPGMTADGTINSKAFPAMLIEIRNYATSKAAASKITEIDLNAQRTIQGYVVEGEAPADASSDDKNIYISYNGNKNLVITIPSASTSNPYEYCVVKPGATFDINHTVWSTITKNTPVKILGSKAVEGGTLYIRMKEIKSKAATRTTPAVEYALASTFVTYSIAYPSTPKLVDMGTYIYVKKGYTENLSFKVKLNEAGKLPYETQLKNIKLGTKSIDFTTVIEPMLQEPIDRTKEYIMTVTLSRDSLESMANCYNKAVTLTYDNGTIDKTSMKLTITNPTAAGTLTLTAKPGEKTGTTNVTVVSNPASGNIFVYTIGNEQVTGKMIQDTLEEGVGVELSKDDITIATDQYLTVYEINKTSRNIVKYRSIKITANQIR